MNKALTIDEAAADLRVSRRWLEYWLADHPVDATGNPFYIPKGRSKTFEDADIKRIRTAIQPFVHRPTFVYFIEAAGHIKIGQAENWQRRFSSIQSSLPIKLKRLLVLRTSANLEKELHAKFAAFRVHGEWFTDCPEIRQYIKGAARKYSLVAAGPEK